MTDEGYGHTRIPGSELAKDPSLRKVEAAESRVGARFKVRIRVMIWATNADSIQ